MDSFQIRRLVWRDLDEIPRLLKTSKEIREHELGRKGWRVINFYLDIMTLCWNSETITKYAAPSAHESVALLDEICHSRAASIFYCLVPDEFSTGLGVLF